MLDDDVAVDVTTTCVAMAGWMVSEETAMIINAIHPDSRLHCRCRIC
jgi:hypothetical protein